MDDKQWPSEWMRGVLSLCVLAVVAAEETYGYAVAQRLQSAGLGRIKGGTLYPVLARLEQDGLLTSQWRGSESGPGRKFFSVTPDGLATLDERTQEWAVFTERATTLATSWKAKA